MVRLMNKMSSRLLLVLLLAAALGAFFALDLGRWLSLEQLRAAQAGLEAAYQDRPLQVIGAYFVVYVAVTALSVPGAVPLTLAGGALFGLGLGHDLPADRLGVGKDAGLDGFVFAGGWHLRIAPAFGCGLGRQTDGLPQFLGGG
jgi:hypothetical protein